MAESLDPLSGDAVPMETTPATDAGAPQSVTSATDAAAPRRAGARKSAAAAAPALPQDFETALAELEGLVARMEDGSLPLEASLLSYKRGVDLVRVCQERLARAENQVKVLEGELLRPIEDSED
ncbi:exodeoxyribonuclease VII small subunit [Pigmentiphaga litoralis]|uniref:Exodeoxyribonuclease 7 small subunit n=1 Tax=Pigmentiphaga litoralis TaxID=516702 RepID=A0A7Y9LQB8_9BURK|nr:exodeoxyribonuclease VII small subunit [Pigmentiphaga litoralis]NYE85858.1 exodeoxyribonuclease VII small subunit [Pigmentiphaga litoralis]